MKKKFQAIKATTADADGLIHDTKEFKFRRDDTFVIEDEGLAREIDQVHGKKGTQNLAIVPYDDNETREPGHNYTFAGVDISHFIKRARANRRVWVWVGNVQKLMKREEAIQKGLKFVSQKRNKRARVRREAQGDMT